MIAWITRGQLLNQDMLLAWRSQIMTTDTDWVLCRVCADKAGIGGRESDLLLTWQLTESCLSGQGEWAIQIQATRVGTESAIGYGWTAMWDDTIPTIAVGFAEEAAMPVLKMFHSAFAALQDRDDYLQQISQIASGGGGKQPGYAIVGSVRDSGAMQVTARWDTTPHIAEIAIAPPEDLLARSVTAILEKGSIARLALATEEAFGRLLWPIPE